MTDPTGVTAAVHWRVRGNELMSQAGRPLRSDVELPVPAQGSPLDFLFAQEEIECCGNRIGALAQLFRQIALADNYVPCRVASVERDRDIFSHRKLYLENRGYLSFFV
jgi:hypothetical protein